MRNLLRALVLAACLLPGVAAAQCNSSTPLPTNTVLGRLGVTPGPCQAIPFAVLTSKLTGAAITLNSGNGQTAPGAMAGGNTYSFGANTDTPRFAGVGFGGAAPATGVEIYNAAVNPTGNGQGVVGSSATNGGVFGGQGSVFDASLQNKTGAVAAGVPTGTQNLVLQGTLTAASLSTSGTIAGSLCMTSGGVVLYEAAINCFAVTGVSVVTGKTLTIDNSIEFAGTDGTKFTFPGTSDTVDTLAANQTISGNKTFSGTLNITGTGQLNGTAFGTFATQNFATPPAIGGTTPAPGAFSTLSATTPMAVSSGGTNASTPAGARASGGINVEAYDPQGDSNYTIPATDRTVGTSTALTAPRTWTLPAASAVNPGQHLYVQDFAGGVNNTNTLTVQRAGSDTVNGSTSITINTSNGAYEFASNGVNGWSAQALGAAATVGVSSINGQTGSPSVVAGTNIGVSVSGGNITVSNTAPAATIIPGAIGGLRLSNDASTPLTVLDISAGIAADSTNTSNIQLGTFTKAFSGVWAAGSGSNGVATGLSITANTWYSVFLVNVSGTPDIYFDIPKVTTTTPPAGTTAYRHLGWFLSDASSHITGETCVDDTCMWVNCQCNAGVGTYDYYVANPCGAGATTIWCSTTITLPNIPPGAPVTAILNTYIANISIPQAAIDWILGSPSAVQTIQSVGIQTNEPQLPTVSGNQAQILTDGYARAQSTLPSLGAGTGSGPTTYILSATGWIYHRTPPAPPSAAIGTPTVVGTAGPPNGTYTSITATSSAAIVKGNTVTVCVGTNTLNSGVTVNGVSDGINTYYRSKQAVVSTGNVLEQWVAFNAVAVPSSTAIVASFSGSTGAGSAASMIVSQQANITQGALAPTVNVAAIANDANASAVGTTATSLTATTGALSQANEIAIGCSFQIAQQTYSGATGFTNLTNATSSSPGNGTVWMDYKQLSSKSAVSYIPTWVTGASHTGAVVATFKGN